MHVINATNVNHALEQGVRLFKELEQFEHPVSPRGFRTIECPEPVATVYMNPTQRVVFSPTRDANPFFHFFESLWMLAGRNDVKFVERFNPQMKAYSDDGLRIWGAYGQRWRHHFGHDQLDELVKLLRADPDSRRGVVAMWSPDGDQVCRVTGHGGEIVLGGPTGKDVPCNTHLYFKIRGGALRMTVCCRSNDMLWGAYGANAVHMSMLQEYLAGKLGVRVGPMTQVSDSLHVYLDDKGGALWAKIKEASPGEFNTAPYFTEVEPFHMGSCNPQWDMDLFDFFEYSDRPELSINWPVFRTDYFREVVMPMWKAWKSRLISDIEVCAASDWRKACREWLERRAK